MQNKINQQEGVKETENKGLQAEKYSIREVIKPLVKNYVLGYIHNLSRLDIEIKRVEGGYLAKIREVVEGAGLTDEKRVKIIQQAVKLYKAGKLKKALYDYIFDKLLQAQLQAILKAIGGRDGNQ